MEHKAHTDTDAEYRRWLGIREADPKARIPAWVLKRYHRERVERAVATGPSRKPGYETASARPA